MSDWTPDQARGLYNLPWWGEDYVDVSPHGHLLVRPRGQDSAGQIDLHDLAGQLHEEGLALPVVVRFTDILAHRIDTLCGAFSEAMEDMDYQGRYTAVYPIKVNQHEHVVSEILRHGGSRIGLEAGSKPELIAVMARSDRNGGTIVCNGYKDQEYIRLALISQALGHRTFIVIEKLSELQLILREVQDTGIRPLLGIRLRLASIAEGKWQNSGGAKSKFGLSASQTLRVIEQLREHDLLDCLRLLHFHLGSQLPNIRAIQTGLRECSQFYAELYQMGVPVEVIDVGGGLGIDYEGTRSRSYCSRNYSVQEYARNVVHAIRETCEQDNLPHPDIISESGRALTAHHAVLLTNVIDTDCVADNDIMEDPGEDAPTVLQDMYQLALDMDNGDNSRSAIEAWHDASYWLTQAQEMYTHGVLSLADRARAEELHIHICSRIRDRLQPNIRTHRELLDELNEKLADKYFINLSIFQSAPDIWAIDQIFPIVPIHRLDEAPSGRGILQDITCDSDGRIDNYVDGEGIETSLPIHPLRAGEPYILGMFLMGAYQEILGDMHNLFGDTDSINVHLEGEDYILSRPLRGDTVDSVLRYVKYNPDELMENFRKKVSAAELSPEQAQIFLEDLENGLCGYTYLED